MSTLIRSNALNNIPQKKMSDAIAAIENSEDTLQNKNIKLIAINRYYESNIPIEYWTKKMEKDWVGDPRLLAKYNEYIADLKNSYINGKSLCLQGSHGVGKQLCLETDLPTPTGFIKLKDLKEGDQLFDEEGNICNVTKLHPINISPESYRITFDDHTIVDACADHLWLTYTRNDRVKKRNPTIKPTKKIFQTLLFNNGIRKAANHSISCTKPLNYKKQELPINPYLFGLWLGDGDIYNGLIETADLDILKEYSCHIVTSSISDKSKSVAIRVDGLSDKLKKLNLLKKKKSDSYIGKHIPDIYLYSSYEDRLSLLQGLLDSDGSCNKYGGIEFITVIPKLAEQVCQLIKSFGIKTNINVNESYLYETKHKDRHRITFSTKLPVFKLKRKLDKIKLSKSQLSRTEHRFIINIEKIDPKPMRCITVDSPSHLYLITRSFLPTHNTMAATSILKKASNKGYSCLYTTLSDMVNVLSSYNSDDKYVARRELMLVDFLVIDEFDSRFMPSENAADLYARNLENIFRTRSQNKVPTLMCTNSPNIVNSLNGALQQSIDSLMNGYMEKFSVLGKDIRKVKS